MKLLSKALMVFVCLIINTSAFAIPPPPNYRVSSPHPQRQNEEQIWTCPTDSNIVIAVWRDLSGGYVRTAVGRSVDGGNNWIDSLITYTRFTYQSDPCLDVDSDGDFYICLLEWDYQLWNTLSVIKSTDKGLTWDDMVNLPTQTTVFEDKQFITIDRTGGPYDGNLYAAWARYPVPVTGDVSTIMFARLPQDWYFFDTIFAIAPPEDFSYCGITDTFSSTWAQPLVGSDGSVYVFWNGAEVDSTDCIFRRYIGMAKSTDGGLTMSTPVKVINVAPYLDEFVEGSIKVPNGSPTSATDIYGGEFDGNIYMAYADLDTSNIDGPDFNIKFIRSTDGGIAWSEPYYINDDPTGPGTNIDQFHPWLFCNQDGLLICIFYDQRLDIINHSKFDVFAAYSFDGGETFTTNHRITEVSTDPTTISVRNKDGSRAGKIGEYIGVTAYKDHINAVWTDGRDGNQEVWGANWVTPLLEPRLLAPIDGGNVPDGNPHFDWATTWKMGDDQYRIEVATDNQFINIVLTEIVDTTGLELSIKALDDDLYYWRVKAFMISTGDSSEYSAVRSFTTGEYVCVDSDGDGYGDPGYPNNCIEDNCPDIFSLDLTDTDSDGVGDICDNCPETPNPGQEDDDEDGIGNVCEFICGDADGSGAVNILDITFLISYKYKGGPAPDPLESADVNSSGDVNILDITYLIAFLYKDGPEPNCPM